MQDLASLQSGNTDVSGCTLSLAADCCTAFAGVCPSAFKNDEVMGERIISFPMKCFLYV